MNLKSIQVQPRVLLVTPFLFVMACLLEVGTIPKNGSPPTETPKTTALPFLNTPTPIPLGQLRLAFDATSEGNADIYIAWGDGTDLRRLTDDPASDTMPVWSPDGSTIAFSSNRTGENSIYLTEVRCALPPQGGSEIPTSCDTEARRLITGSIFDGEPAWSPDGLNIAFSSFRQENVMIFLIHPDGSNLSRLTDLPLRESGPRWSPDGTMIAFEVADEGNNDIYVALTACARPWSDGFQPTTAEGQEATLPAGCESNPKRLTTHLEFDGAPSWSPDGHWIAFVSTRQGEPAIFVYNVDCARHPGDLVVTMPAGCINGPQRLVSDPVESDFPAWSPDGLRIAFIGSRDTLYVADTSCARVLGRDCTTKTIPLARIPGAGILANPTWSPDGHRIAFVSGQEILVIDTDCRPEIPTESQTLLAEGAAAGCNGPLTVMGTFSGNDPVWKP